MASVWARLVHLARAVAGQVLRACNRAIAYFAMMTPTRPVLVIIFFFENIQIKALRSTVHANLSLPGLAFPGPLG